MVAVRSGKREPKVVEDRQKQPNNYVLIARTEDKYVVKYPDPGWVDCGPTCVGCDKQPSARNQAWIASVELHNTQAQAIHYASWLGYDEFKLVGGK